MNRMPTVLFFAVVAAELAGPADPPAPRPPPPPDDLAAPRSSSAATRRSTSTAAYRFKPFVSDWNGDGKPDLLFGACLIVNGHELHGYVWVCLRK